ALVHESQEVGLVVVGAHTGPVPADPVALRSIAAMTCPVAIVPHHLVAAAEPKPRPRRRRSTPAGTSVPTH
ncbi:hypothetical protein FB561_7583, partial [Kribbella amoyensis]